MATRRSKKRFQKIGKRYEQKDRRVPRRKGYSTLSRGSRKSGGKNGGKFTWGNELEDYEEYADYDNDEQEFEQAQEDEMAEAYHEFATGTELFYKDLRRYKKFIKQVILEFFEHGDAGDVLQALGEYNEPRFNYEFVKRSISMSLDRRNREREMVSQLISVLHGEGQFLQMEDVADGFIGVFEQMDDLKLDCPQAPRYVRNFLARAVTDECLAPRYLERGSFIEAGGEVVREARNLLSIKHGTSRMERVWGSSAFAVNDLKKDVRDLVREFLISGDIAEAVQCVRDLDSRNFHHEVIKRSIELSMDYSVDKQKQVAQLLQVLYMEEIIHPTQFVIGFKRLFGSLSSLRCDVPAADAILHGFVVHGRRAGYLPASYVPPSYLEAQTSDEEVGDAESNSPVMPPGFTAEIAEQMQEFPVISPRTTAQIVESIGIPEDVIAAAKAAGIDSDTDDDASSSSDEAEASGVRMAAQGLNLLQTGLNSS